MLDMSSFLNTLRSTITNASDVVKGGEYVILELHTSGKYPVMDNVYIAKAVAADDECATFDIDGQRVEFSNTKFNSFQPANQVKGVLMNAYPLNDATRAVHDDIAHRVAAHRLRQEIADTVCGMAETTVRGEMDAVRKLQSLANDLAYHEGELNQSFLDDKKHPEIGPLVVRPADDN